MTSTFFTVSRRSGERAVVVVVSTSGGAFGSVVNVEFFFTGFRVWAPWLGWWRTVLTDWLWPADPLFAEAFTTRQHWPDEHRKAISTSLCVKVAYLELLNKWVFFLLRGEGEEKWWPKRGLNCRGVAMESLVVVGPYYQLGVRNSTINISPKSSKNKQANKEAMSQTFSCPRHYFSPPTFSTEQHYQQFCNYSKNPKLQETRIWAGVGGGGVEEEDLFVNWKQQRKIKKYQHPSDPSVVLDSATVSKTHNLRKNKNKKPKKNSGIWDHYYYYYYYYYSYYNNEFTE